MGNIGSYVDLYLGVVDDIKQVLGPGESAPGFVSSTLTVWAQNAAQ
jgi:hypothetical protein